MQHKSNSFLILLVFFFLFQIIKCKNTNSEADVGYGKTYFNQNCNACHGQLSGFENAPSLSSLNNYDSLDLLKKLISITKDSLHRHRLESVNYSNKEINSINVYIKNYFKPHY